MKTVDVNTSLIESYFGLIKNLSPELKLDLIDKLTKTLKSDLNKKNTLKNSFGAWKSTKSADDIVNELRENRSFNREIESF